MMLTVNKISFFMRVENNYPRATRWGNIAMVQYGWARPPFSPPNCWPSTKSMIRKEGRPRASKRRGFDATVVQTR